MPGSTTIKLVVIGASGVGKTTLRGKYVKGRFSEGYRATVGADFITKVLPNPTSPHHSSEDPGMVTLQIWDTAGQERFSSLSSAFFRGADACLLMFDVNSPATLASLTKWWKEFCDHCPVFEEELADFCVVVVGNKTDLVEATLAQGKSVVSQSEAESFLEDLIPLEPSTVSQDPPNGIDPYASSPQNGIAFPSTSPSKATTTSIAIQHNQSRPARRSTVSMSPNTVTATPRGTSHSRSRSFTRLNSHTGTMNSVRSALSIYHTPSSSLFESYHSARSSPELGWSSSSSLSLPSSSRPSSPTGKGNRNVSVSGGSPSHSTRLGRRPTPTLSSGSLVTLTPSLFARQRLEAEGRVAAPSRPLDRGPKLFLTSAKTGDNVADVFEYISQRVTRRMEWEESSGMDLIAEPSNGHTPITGRSAIRLGSASRRGVGVKVSDSTSSRLSSAVGLGSNCCA